MEDFINKLKPYTKTIVAGIVGLLNLLQLYIQLNANGLSTEDVNALIGAIILLIGGTTAVYQFPNTKASK